jgi:hypothetical protein
MQSGYCMQCPLWMYSPWQKDVRSDSGLTPDRCRAKTAPTPHQGSRSRAIAYNMLSTILASVGKRFVGRFTARAPDRFTRSSHAPAVGRHSMDLIEYQARERFAAHAVPVPPGIMAST